MPLRTTPPALAALSLALAAAFPALAQTPVAPAGSAATPAAPTTATERRLKEIVVSGSRSEQLEDEVPASIDVLAAPAMEEAQVHDIRDAAAQLPNVSVRHAPARFSLAAGNTGRDANAGFNIRGLDGNRVLMLTDGIRLPRSYVYSAVAFGRDSSDLSLIKRIEVVRGPASVLYGSDGVAGLVNLITWDPSDFLTDGKDFGGRVGLSYSGDDNGRQAFATLAGRFGERTQWLLSASHTRADGLENQGSNNVVGANRSTPNPEDDRNTAVMGKLVWRPNADQKHVFTLEHVGKKADYDLLHTVTATTLSTTAQNDFARNRATWDATWQLGSPFADSIQTVLSWQAADSRETAYEDRTPAADRVRDTTYDEHTLQANIQAQKIVRMSPQWSQKITYGLDLTRADVTNLVNGVTPPAGETFPLKRFPDTRETTTAFYLQDEFISDRWSITPGIRIDRYRLDADQAGFGGVAISQSKSHVSPKLGILYRATPQWSVYGNYATGFKAPNASQLNGFFENLIANYKTVSNPNLKPETSQNFELGLRGRLERVTLDAAVFTGRFKNLIQDFAYVSGNMTAANPTIFQSINVDNARISGLEFKGTVEWGKVGPGSLSSPFSWGRTRGRNLDTGRPINGIDPEKTTLGLRYEAAPGSIGLYAVHHAAKSASDIDFTPLATQFATPAATTFDIRAQWRIRRDLRLNVAVENLTDRKYWMWSDVNAVARTSTVLDAYTQPGRHVNVSLVMDF